MDIFLSLQILLFLFISLQVGQFIISVPYGLFILRQSKPAFFSVSKGEGPRQWDTSLEDASIVSPSLTVRQAASDCHVKNSSLWNVQSNYPHLPPREQESRESFRTSTRSQHWPPTLAQSKSPSVKPLAYEHEILLLQDCPH